MKNPEFDKDITPDETAEFVLSGVLGHRDMTFSEFRAAMIDRHPDYLSDEAIHDLYERHTKALEDLTPAEQVVKRLDTYTAEEHQQKLAEARERIAQRRAEHPEFEAFKQRAFDRDPAVKKAYEAAQEPKPILDYTLNEVADGIARRARAMKNLIFKRDA